ncbi:hypothetical protein Y695_03694 [Hydrogenophaga sp. T4]|nr:hypothetical protein Y695_03694 [Hydrogenophaga sp. T4]
MHAMTQTLPLIGASVLLLVACGTVEPQKPLALLTAPAPVSYDGHVAGEATDYVFVLVPDANPVTPGLALKAGESLQLALSPAFKRNASVPIVADRDTNLVLTKGWPQVPCRWPGSTASTMSRKTMLSPSPRSRTLRQRAATHRASR